MYIPYIGTCIYIERERPTFNYQHHFEVCLRCLLDRDIIEAPVVYATPELKQEVQEEHVREDRHGSKDAF